MRNEDLLTFCFDLSLCKLRLEELQISKYQHQWVDRLFFFEGVIA